MPPRRTLLFALLGAALLLRVALVLSGGQSYWPDEIRYERSRLAVTAMSRGDLSGAVTALAHPDHLLFGVLGLAPAALERATGANDRVPALFFALFSVASVWLLHAIARRLGLSERASLLAALLLAMSASQLYFSRHLLPYDAAMAFGLGALLIAVKPVPAPADGLLCGLLAAATLLTYNGYWLLALAAIAIHVMAASSLRASVPRLAAAGAAFALPFLAIGLASVLATGAFFREWAEFAGTVTQGRFAEGWSLPFAYFWHAEHLMGALWAFGVAAATVRLVRGDPSRTVAFGLAGILLVYAGLVLGSVALGRFVVYGRQARQLVPFACLLAADALERLLAAPGARRLIAAAILALAAIQAAWNFRAPLAQVFPREFRRMAAAVPNPTGAPRLLLYAAPIYPVPAPPPPEAGRVLLARAHPLQYLPYQYEGYTPEERAALRAADIRMRLVEVRPAH